MLTAAYAFSPVKEQQDIKPVVEPVYVMAPFTFVEFEKKDQAVFETADSEYVLEVDFESTYTNHNNGVGHNWNEVEVHQIKDIHVYNEDGEVLNAYVDRLDVQEIVQVIEQELRKPA
ncbi:hypothetical protein MMP61_19015 [Acinetobacter sp. NIPH 1958]|uniref:hypothetical protein n=1 Tax=Acinetobacter sp. NIPH 1958 TaxID=2923430 RepID=UPI001F4A98C6|nr:hypothetical protein [Acinetobacter sp. NIPH 1958]MCH7357631.1 hypothetical protein [Acinetobacter sp. NIPH 1958]